VNITIEASDGLGIRISDDGKGLISTHKFSGGNGLMNMQQRMESIGGKLYVRNGEGFTITMSVPLK
jgi:two-component system NarL family sensor kinase